MVSTSHKIEKSDFSFVSQLPAAFFFFLLFSFYRAAVTTTAAAAHTDSLRCNEAISRDNNGRNSSSTSSSTNSTFPMQTPFTGNVSTMKIYNRSEIRNHFKSLSMVLCVRMCVCVWCPRSFCNLFCTFFFRNLCDS